ncbi:LANO_0B07712g1_1 [Lachancea nothofagi CBS 11611]|uniref:LANO_0B07712g1_1 n=1 Tax=Lachancea nothofagi CBS 11611 TaxID=1266666 RepID=A0A1G4J0J0_9SACH|nr:LANO_0B07712g1_1 [Lachancea nothofagi CBS 11611]
MSLNTRRSQADSDVDYIINALQRANFNGGAQGISSNLLYYLPRIRRMSKLENLVESVLESKLWSTALNGNFSILQEMTEAIFSWKLEISEPAISISEFYEVWDVAIKRCQTWTIAQLAILCGALCTKSKFESLQSKFFLDDGGLVAQKYIMWKERIFIPVWRQLFVKSLDHPEEAEQLAIFLTRIFEPNDLKRVPADPLTNVLMKLSLSYVRNPQVSTPTVSKSLSHIAKTLEVVLPIVGPQLVTQALDLICVICFELSQKELLAPQANYSSQVHSNQLLTTILIFRGCISRGRVPLQWYRQVAISLFYLNYIVQDFGKVGFDSYEYIYDVCATGIMQDFAQYSGYLEVMRGNIWDSQINNAVNSSRILYLLNFMESTLTQIKVTPAFLENFIVPVLSHFGKSSNTAICEAAYAAHLSLYSNHFSGRALQVWKTSHCRDFLNVSTTQYLNGILSSTQLVHIYCAIAEELPTLRQINNDISREVMQFTYLRVVNSGGESPQVVATLIQCLIKQLPHIGEQYLVDWLENCVELIRLCPSERDRILDSIWAEVTSAGISNRGLTWFLNMQSKL